MRLERRERLSKASGFLATGLPRAIRAAIAIAGARGATGTRGGGGGELLLLGAEGHRHYSCWFLAVIRKRRSSAHLIRLATCSGGLTLQGKSDQSGGEQDQTRRDETRVSSDQGRLWKAT